MKSDRVTFGVEKLLARVDKAHGWGHHPPSPIYCVAVNAGPSNRSHKAAIRRVKPPKQITGVEGDESNVDSWESVFP